MMSPVNLHRKSRFDSVMKKRPGYDFGLKASEY